MPLLYSHAIQPYGHLKDYFLPPSPCCLVKITTSYDSEVQDFIFVRKKPNNRPRDFWWGGGREVNCLNSQQILRAKEALPSYIPLAKIIKYKCHRY